MGVSRGHSEGKSAGSAVECFTKGASRQLREGGVNR